MRDDALKIMSESDVVVFPSLKPEGFGLTVAEAMHLGKPVIAAPVGGTAELVQNGVTGLAVEPGDVGALAQAVRDLLDDRERAQALGSRGKRFIEQLVSDQNALVFQRLLEDVATGDFGRQRRTYGRISQRWRRRRRAGDG